MHPLAESRIHLPFDGRLKLLYCLILLGLNLASSSVSFQLILFLTHFLPLLILKISLRDLLKAYLEPLFIVVMLILLKSLSLSPLSIDPQGWQEGLTLGVRVISSFTIFLFTFYTLSFTELLRAFGQLRFPSLLLELLLLTYRFLFLLFEELSHLYFSQKNRLGFSTLRTYPRSVIYLSQALFFRMLEHADQALLSMKQRGYDFSTLLSNSPKLQRLEITIFFVILFLWILLYLYFQG